MRAKRKKHGLTLVELLVALMVASIVLSAVAALAYAMGEANDSTDDTSRKQAQVRYATLRVSDLIRHCKLICDSPGDDLVVWRADDDGDDEIDIGELVYIVRSAGKNHLWLGEFDSANDTPIQLSQILTISTKWWLGYGCDITYTKLIPQCGDVQVAFDTSPPWSKFACISFDLEENGVTHHYQISAAVHSWAGNMLDGSGQITSDDD